MTGEWLRNPQLLLYPTAPRTLCHVTVAQPDTRAAGGGGAYAHSVGVALVRAATLLDKGPALTRADLLNPPPLEFGPGREAGLRFAVTLEPRDGPYVAVAFGDRGRRGDLVAVVWHSKPVLVRAGASVWQPDGAVTRHPDDADEPLEPGPAEGPDPDPHDEHRPAVGRSAAAVAQHQRAPSDAAAAAAGESDSGGGGREPGHRRDSDEAEHGRAGTRRDGGGGRGDRGDVTGMDGYGGKGGLGTGGAGRADGAIDASGRQHGGRESTAGAAEAVTAAGSGYAQRQWAGSGGGDDERDALARRIVDRLGQAQLWQLQAIAKILD